MDPRSYLGTFLDESREHLQTLHAGFLALDEGIRSDALFSELFRSAHTLKGMSASMGYTATSSFMHQLEEVMGYLRLNPDAIDASSVDSLLIIIDWLDAQIDTIQETSSENPHIPEAVFSQLQSLCLLNDGLLLSTEPHGSVDPVGSPSELIAKLQAVVSECFLNAVPAWFCEVTIAQSCLMKGARALLVTRVIESYGDILGSAPPVAAMQGGDFEQKLQFVVAIRSGTGEDMMTSVRDLTEVETVNGWLIHGMVRDSESASGHSPTPQSEDDDERGPHPVPTSSGMRRGHRHQPIVRIPAENIDMLMNLVSELVIDKNRLVNLSDRIRVPELSFLSEHVSRVASDLQRAVLAMRMEPVEALFQRFDRTIRDLNRRLDKQIELVCKGGNTTCDRMIMDELAEILVHLIRNAADHGIEMPDERIAAGKRAVGTIALTAYASGQELYIDVVDDGQGVNLERVLAKAIQIGLVDKRAANQMNAEQVIELLFAQGFSTSSEVTDISGRGVGLDVVREKMVTLGGTVSASTNRGKGTTFQLRVPLSLSIIRAILVDIHGQTFALPTASVDEVLSVTEPELRTIQGRWVLEHDGFLTPVVDAGSLLMDKPSTAAWPWRLAILAQGNRKMAMAVTRVLGQLDIVHKPLGQYLRNAEWFSGATLLGDGEIALIMNVSRWFDEASPSISVVEKGGSS